MLGFQNRALYVNILKFHANQDNSAYLKKSIFNKNSFFDSETSIEFVESKRVQEWSRIPIASPSWLGMPNETNFNWQFLQFVSKNVIFYKLHQT